MSLLGAIRVARRIISLGVLETMADAMIVLGVPEHIRSDNGPEMTAKIVPSWLLPFRLISRLTVDGDRPRSRAIPRIDRPAPMLREISSRSSSLSYATARQRGFGAMPPS
jgi:hypothetical protein